MARSEYQAGQLLPDEVTLAGQVQVSRNTLRAAMSRLVFEGLLERTPKVGTRVARRRLDEWHSFRGEMAGKGIVVVDFAIECCRLRAGSEEAAALAVGAGSLVWRLRGWDGQPMLEADSWRPPRLGVTDNEAFSQPLYEVLRLAGSPPPVRSQERIGAIAADRELAHSLGLACGAPVLVRRRTVLDRKRQAIEFNLNWYRADRYTFSLDLAAGTVAE